MIRNAKRDDLPAIRRIYEIARRYMAENGNPTQWGDSYPALEQLEEDIARERLYLVCDQGGQPHGVFYFAVGEDPSYARIDGKWLNDRPYGVIHRIASDGSHRGVFAQCLEFCTGRCSNIRADTHLRNATMRHLLEGYGFILCGTIELELREGDPLRLAYQYTPKGGDTL